MAALASYLPSLSIFDPRDAAEGTIDPLGMATLANRFAELLVPGFTERVRRPRFLTILALGARVLSRRGYDGGTYGLSPDGPAYLGWERLVAESYAQIGKRDDETLLGVPGIQKARSVAAKGKDWRLSSQLYLKGAAAVGSWTAYKAIAVEIGVLDRHGQVGETGWELLEAWAEAIGEPDCLRSEQWLAMFDEALGPLLQTGPARWNPRQCWTFIYEKLNPRGMTAAEAVVLREPLE